MEFKVFVGMQPLGLVVIGLHYNDLTSNTMWCLRYQNETKIAWRISYVKKTHNVAGECQHNLEANRVESKIRLQN